MEKMSARELLGQSNIAREQEKYQQSLQMANLALDAFVSEKDFGGFAEAVAGMFLTRKHQGRVTGYKGYLLLGLSEMKASVEIVETLNDPKALALPYFNLAKAFEELEKWGEAVEYFQKAIEFQQKHPHPNHDRPAVLADFKVHLVHAQFKNGDKSALQSYEGAIAELAKSGEEKISDYNLHVWLSGAHMNFALDLFENGETEKAKEQIQKAKEIIDSDERLTIRKQQLDELIKKLGFD